MQHVKTLSKYQFASGGNEEHVLQMLTWMRWNQEWQNWRRKRIHSKWQLEQVLIPYSIKHIYKSNQVHSYSLRLVTSMINFSRFHHPTAWTPKPQRQACKWDKDRQVNGTCSLYIQWHANFLKLAQMQSPNSVLAFYHFESPSGLQITGSYQNRLKTCTWIPTMCPSFTSLESS